MNRVRIATTLALVALSCGAVHAQSAPAPELKAAFLLNFVRFTEWPDDVAGAGTPLTLCVTGDPAVADALERSAKGRTIEGHELLVVQVAPDALPRPCHLLYAAGLNGKQVVALVSSVAGTASLTVGDDDTCTRLGAVANFFVENGKMRFALNPDAALRAHLRLSSKLLSLAKLVKDDAHARP